MNDVVVKVNNLGKQFKIYSSPWGRALEWATWGKKTYHKDFGALHGISFEVKKGECLGIIGPNGAGKSTLLKILTRSLYPTTGTFQISGNVLSLLELGTGFNWELTGRQNIYRSSQLLGFPKLFVSERIQNIQEFADIGDFFDRPIKIYSSGMYIRLAFAMFVSLQPEVLVVDEGLAVGDIFFQQKCYKRLEDLIRQGTTLILVTHDITVVSQFCNSAMVLDHGYCIFHGDPITAIRKFFALQKGSLTPPLVFGETTKGLVSDQGSVPYKNHGSGFRWPSQEAFLSLSTVLAEGLGAAECTAIALCDKENNPCQVFQMGQDAFFYYEFLILEDIQVPIGGLTIVNDKNIFVHGKNTLQHALEVPPHVPKGTRLRFRQKVTLDVGPGEYTFVLGLATIDPIDYRHAKDMSLEALTQRITRVLSIGRAGHFVVTPCRDCMALPHHGLCNLPGQCDMMILLSFA
jgi:ABC-type polysaccharide/polyol phosphate transport system ATPase subunit